MARTTIDYGIDLGTTNSTVAVLVGTTPEVIANKDGSSITPSAIWFDKRGTQHVGREARARHIDDEENAAVEFKLRMGESWQKVFQRSGRKMAPEELSAEVLKSLKTDVRTNRGEELNAAVITVPAAFELPQCEATRRAAELAGLAVGPLLQEPVAAALAYGFQSATNKVFWLIYDFGGGTFDAAVIQVRDGVIQVVNHAGDNYLGGKNIDWDIVEKLLIPRLTRERPLSQFRRDNPKWRAATAKLKYWAEEGKIQVSRTKRPWDCWVENLCVDDRGEQVDFHIKLTPTELQKIIEPWVVQSINLCRRALQEKGLTGRDVEKTILVGGSSLLPWLQERVSAELGTKLDFSVDPITVVARGAAVFAGTQRLTADDAPVAAGTYKIELEYEPVGSETNPMIGGRIIPPRGGTTGGLTVEIIETRSQWRSGSIRVADAGTFITEIHAEKGRKCEYRISLSDSRGSRLPCSPEHFAYTVGMVITSPPLTHSIGVAMANNRVDLFFKKGEALPARVTKVHHTALALRKAEPPGPGNAIRIPIVEGDNRDKADRNRLIGNLEILPSDPRIKRDVPAGSEIEITVEMDASRTAKTKAFIPILDEEFEGVFQARITTKSPAQLRAELEHELDRLQSLHQRAQAVGDRKAQAALAQVENEQLVETTKRQVAAAQGDPEARGEGDKKLLNLRAAVDSVESALEWPTLIQEARSQLVAAKDVVDQHGNAEERNRLRVIEGDIERAIAGERLDLLRAGVEDLRSLGVQVVVRQPGFWVGYLEYVQERRALMTDQVAAERLFAQAARAINNNDIEALKAAVRQLVGLLPPDEQEAAEARGAFGGTTISH